MLIPVRAFMQAQALPLTIQRNLQMINTVFVVMQQFLFIKTVTTRKVIEKPTRMVAPANPNRWALKKFLENDRKVLRFYCYWDNTEELFGEKRKYVCILAKYSITLLDDLLSSC